MTWHSCNSIIQSWPTEFNSYYRGHDLLYLITTTCISRVLEPILWPTSWSRLFHSAPAHINMVTPNLTLYPLNKYKVNEAVPSDISSRSLSISQSLIWSLTVDGTTGTWVKVRGHSHQVRSHKHVPSTVSVKFTSTTNIS